MVDLWIMQPQKFLDIALEEGFRKFCFPVYKIVRNGYDILAQVRAGTAAYGPVDVMMIDDSGAAEYNTFSSYLQPRAVYPTWSPMKDEWEQLIWLLENPVGQNETFCNDPGIASEMRPVWGQDHKVVVYSLMKTGQERADFILRLHQLQLDYPEATIMLVDCSRFSDLFGLSFKQVSYLPMALSVHGLATGQIHLPSGRLVKQEKIHDRRYKDWFHLVGMDQLDVLDIEDQIRFCLRSARWASLNFSRVTPFVASRPTSSSGKITVFVPNEFHKVSEANFILPAARRKLMRNLGIHATDLDKFRCDTCILHNACTLYREGSVCTVEGSDTVALADSFGTRNAQAIINGLTEIVKRNAERLEDAMTAEEKAADGLDPEVTKLTKTVFDQGVKLAKLIDPALAGGPKVQVNVGVAGGAQVAVSGSDPKQLMATVVAELESAGIPRDKIDGDMIKGVLRNMAQSGQQQAVSTAAAKYQMQSSQKAIEGEVA